MNVRLQAALAVVFALLVATAVPGTVAAASPPVNFDDDRAPNPYIHEDTLTIAEWDNSEFDSLTEYYNDDGEADEIPATVNTSQDEQLRFRADKVDESSWQQFPRVDGESENNHTWLNASNWTTTTNDGTNVTPTVADDDDTTASGVPAVECSTSGMGSGDTAHCEFETSLNITSDVSKRTLQFVGNFPTLDGDIELRLIDADGDYYYAVANTSANATKDHVIANETGNGYVFQEKTNNLLSSGTVDEIQKVQVNVSDADVDMTLVGLDAEKKGTFDLGETKFDFDGDGDEDDDGSTKTISEVYDSPDRPEGAINYTSADTLGSELSDATIHDLEVWHVRYEMADLTDEDDWDVAWEDAPNYGSYPKKLNYSTRLRVPSQIDLSHGTLDLEDEQGLVDERYAVVEVAEDTGDTNLTNVSDSDFTSKSGNYTNKDGTITLDDSVSAGQNYIVHAVILLQDDEVDALKGSSTAPAAGGPTGGGGGGIFAGAWDFVTSPFGAVVSLFGTLLAAPRIIARMAG